MTDRRKTRYTKSQDALEHRRVLVARLRMQGLTVREVASRLEELGVVNPHTGKAYTHPVVVNDLLVMRQEWVEAHREATAEAQARTLAELEEVKRQAWQRNDLNTVLRALDQIAKIAGLYAPSRVDIRDATVKLAREHARTLGLDEDEVVATTLRLIE